jgi:hypothetical protein
MMTQQLIRFISVREMDCGRPTTGSGRDTITIHGQIQDDIRQKALQRLRCLDRAYPSLPFARTRAGFAGGDSPAGASRDHAGCAHQHIIANGNALHPPSGPGSSSRTAARIGERCDPLRLRAGSSRMACVGLLWGASLIVVAALLAIVVHASAPQKFRRPMLDADGQHCLAAPDPDCLADTAFRLQAGLATHFDKTKLDFGTA